MNTLAVKGNMLVENIERVIVGKRKAAKLVVATLLSGGHVLLEDVPGVGKTILGRAISRSINGTFKRIQFTPDLLPSDITGTTVFDQKTGQFRFVPGPAFANVVLADEINRATPRAQASLLEAMDEGKVTVDGKAYWLPKPFFVIATQNPIEYHGTYPLPEGQLDRFMTSLSLGYPSPEEEARILEMQRISHPIDEIEPVLSTEEILEMQREVREIYIDRSLTSYIVEIVSRTRSRGELLLGASPRGSIAIMRLSQAWAGLEGRDYCIPDDIKAVAEYALSHRMMVRGKGYFDRKDGARIIGEILEEVPVP
jgi:MoxR-like ATPase